MREGTGYISVYNANLYALLGYYVISLDRSIYIPIQRTKNILHLIHMYPREL